LPMPGIKPQHPGQLCSL